MAWYHSLQLSEAQGIRISHKEDTESDPYDDDNHIHRPFYHTGLELGSTTSSSAASSSIAFSLPDLLLSHSAIVITLDFDIFSDTRKTL